MKFKIILISALAVSTLYPMEKTISKSNSIKNDYISSLLKSAQELLEEIKKEANKLLGVPMFLGGNDPLNELMGLHNDLEIKLNYIIELKEKHENFPADQAVTKEYTAQLEMLEQILQQTNEKFEALRI